MGLHDIESIFLEVKWQNTFTYTWIFKQYFKPFFMNNFMVSEMAQPYCYPHFIMFTQKLMKYQYHWLRFISILEVCFYFKISNEIAHSIYYYWMSNEYYII